MIHAPEILPVPSHVLFPFSWVEQIQHPRQTWKLFVEVDGVTRLGVCVPDSPLGGESSDNQKFLFVINTTSTGLSL